VLSPERLILGGGVMQAQSLLPLVRRHLRSKLGGYVQADALREGEGIEGYVVAPGLGERSGIAGALALAQAAARASSPAAQLS
jgi:fructokinase